jgi:hypothetical protein
VAFLAGPDGAWINRQTLHQSPDPARQWRDHLIRTGPITPKRHLAHLKQGSLSCPSPSFSSPAPRQALVS